MVDHFGVVAEVGRQWGVANCSLYEWGGVLAASINSKANGGSLEFIGVHKNVADL